MATRPMTSIPFRQAVELQTLILNDARTADLKPIVRAGLARAFVELEECKRKLKMRPLPKPVDVSDRQPKGRRKSTSSAKAAFAESDAPPTPPQYVITTEPDETPVSATGPNAQPTTKPTAT